MNSTLTPFAASVAIAIAALAGPALAEDAKLVPAAYQQDVGASERVNFSGKLRMLSQRIPSAACHLAADVDVEASQALLASATAEFEKILNALEFGDADLNINGAEERRKTLAKVHALRDAWAPVKSAADAMVGGDTAEGTLKTILGQNIAVLGAAKDLVVEVVGAYSNPNEIVHADAYVIDMAGRQRMLTQKISKESCMLSTGRGDAATADALRQTIEMFEVTLQALRHGMPAVGIKRPPTAAIASGLDEVSSHWDGVKPTLDAILTNSAIDEAASVQKFHGLNATMKKMNEVVGMYSKASKHES